MDSLDRLAPAGRPPQAAPSRRPLALALALAGLAACPSPAPKTPLPARTVAEVVATLAIPPTASSDAGLDWLAARAAEGEVSAAVAALEYDLALFDDARFARRRASRETLLRRLSLPSDAPAGTATTAKVLDRLAGRVQGVLLAARRSEPALQARATALQTLIDFERKRPTSRAEVIGWLAPLKALTAEAGVIGPAARLRRFALCRQALAAATRGSALERVEQAQFCLFANHDADPTPFFDPELSRRPPPPRWRDLAADASGLLGRADDRVHPWLRGAITGAHEGLQSFIADNLEELPTLALERGLELPLVPAPGIAPYAHTPLAVLGTSVEAIDAAVGSLAKPLIGDGRGVIALAAPANLDAALLVHGAQRAADITAASIDLVVAIELPLRRDQGSYWAVHASGERLRTAGALRLSLFKLWSADDSVRSRDWDPDRATLGLHLLIEPRRWILVGLDGVVASVPLHLADDGEPTATTYAEASVGLRHAARQVITAYRRERGVFVRAADAVTVANLAAAIAAVRTDADGTALLDLVALTTRPIAAQRAVLARRIDARLRATVESELLSASSRLAVLDCYRSALDTRPGLTTRLRFERRADGGFARKLGDKDRELTACIANELDEAFRLAETRRIEIGLSLATKP